MGITGKLVPIIEVQEFKKYISTPFGNASFKLKKSLYHNSYILEYYVNGESLGSIQLPVWRNDSQKKAYIILVIMNATGEKQAFESLFQEIQGKMIGQETFIMGRSMFKGEIPVL
ncbi:MAG: hypothetical protein ACTSUE_19100 [Promethearchaeota archaeon]